jgi:hypothetical protein
MMREAVDLEEKENVESEEGNAGEDEGPSRY